MKHHDLKESWGEIGSKLKEVRTRTQQGRILEAGADAEAMKGCCLLACLSWLTQLACFSLFHIVLFDRVSLYVLAVLDLAL